MNEITIPKIKIEPYHMFLQKKKVKIFSFNLKPNIEKGVKNMIETVNDFKTIIENAKKDIKSTRFKIIENANYELINLYFRLGKIIDENWKYGNNFVNELSLELKLEFPNMKGLSSRNLSRMRVFYKEYKNMQNLPVSLANLPWTHNYTLIEKVKDRKKRLWYAQKCLENGWSQIVLIHQIETDLYQRQKENVKLSNFKEKMPLMQSEMARDMMKDPYIFELSNLKEKTMEIDIENAMLERIKNLLLEFGKGFSFVGNQYKISTNNNDYYLDLLFYHLDLRCYIVVELKNTNFKPEYIGQLSFYVTAVNKTLKKEYDNESIGLLLCNEKDKLSVEWALESTNNPIGVSSYEINKYIPKDILEKLPTEEELNLHMDIN